jgi:hypothetical protein
MKKIFRYISVLAIGVAASSCEEFLDINTSPTLLKDVNVAQVMPAAQVNLAFHMGLDPFLWSSIFVQQGAGQGIVGTQTREYDKYVLSNTEVNNGFNIFYSGILADVDALEKIAMKSNNPQHAGIAKLLEAFTFSIVVDLWGDVPYTEALQGVLNVQPKYDNSKDIYDALFLKIDEGLANLAEPNFLPVGNEDLIYGGNIARWIKFGNTLKLRLALHYAKVDGGAILRSVISAGGPFFEANADNFHMTFVNETNKQNPFVQYEIQRTDYYAPGDFIIDLMNAKADPRRATYYTRFPYTAGPTATYQGTVSGDPLSTQYSRLHTYFKGPVVADLTAGGTLATGKTANGGITSTAITYAGTAPVRMMTFAEYNFIRAEAALQYGAAGVAETFYDAGITASMQDAGITDQTVIDAYLAAEDGVTLQKLIEEKYVALAGVAVESWTDYRRTGFPVISPSPAAVIAGNTTIPRVMIYPISEASANLANLPERPSMAVKSIFWDN